MSGRAGALSPRILFLFMLVILIWGSTWIVIADQLGPVPPTWSVTYRFIIAAAAMFAYARFTGASLRLDRNGHVLAVLFGLLQFFANFNFIYAAEHYVTSGLVAVMFAMLMVPNSVFAWLFLKQRVTRQFVIGSVIALVGIALLFVQELRTNSASQADVLLGIGLALLSVLSASAGNIMQASERLKTRPVPTTLAWGMTYGVIADAIFALIVYGPPVIEYRAGYWFGVVYLGLLASAFAFTIYFGIVREIGPGKAAYSSVIIPVVAMALSTLFEGYIWSPLAIGGGIMAMTGMVIALKASRRPATAPVLEPA